MLKAPVIQLAGAFCNIKFTLISTLWYNGLVVFYRYKNGYKENIVLINQTAKKILKALSFDGVEVEAFRHMADLKRLDPMKIFYKKIDSTQNEIWRLIGITSNKEVASFIYKIFKTIRKYGGSGVAITQDVSDLFSLDNGTYGKSILNNSNIKVFFCLEEENINILEKYAKLSEKEKIEIKSFSKGECLMFVGNDHILVKIDSSDFEKNIIEKGEIDN